MGQTTPNMGIYVPSAGETNYDQSFLAGMLNVDQHDHSGGPNKGVPIASSGLADESVTYEKLNSNVADTSTGIGTQSGAFANRLEILGILKNLYQLATAAGFIAKNGSAVTARTMTGTANQVAVTNGDGIAGDPTFALAPIVTNLATQPSFQAYNNAPVANVTGDGTTYEVTWNTVDYDTNGDFSSPAFTAPVDGIYYFTASLVLTGLAVGHVNGQAYFKSSTGETQYGMRLNPYATSDGGVLAFEANSLYKLSAGDTVSLFLQVSGGAKVVSVYGAALTNEPSSFQGILMV